MFDTFKSKGVPEEIWSTKGPKINFELEEDNSGLYIDLPDSCMNTLFKVRINMEKESFIKAKIKEYMATRKSLKNNMKKVADKKKQTNDEAAKSRYDTQIASLNSEQNAIKVIINSIYGVFGNQHGLGDLPIAVAVTALCRYTIQKLVDYVGDDLVELDTDGIVVVGDYTLDQLNKEIEKIVLETGATTNYMFLEEETFERGLFYKAKNYIIIEEDGQPPIIHGAAFKGSKLTPMEVKLRDKLIDFLLVKQYDATKDPDKLQEIMDWVDNESNFELEDFLKVVKAEKDMSEYKTSENAVIARLNMQGQTRGFQFDKDDRLYYIRTKRTTDFNDEIMLVTDDMLSNKGDLLTKVDFDAYLQNEVSTMFNVFNLEYVGKSTTSEGLFG
jgi:DNA polymerase elongation subunit (family B)